MVWGIGSDYLRSPEERSEAPPASTQMRAIMGRRYPLHDDYYETGLAQFVPEVYV